MPFFSSRTLLRLAVSSMVFGVVGNGCGGRSDLDFDFDVLEEGGHASGGGQGGASSTGGSAPASGGTSISGGQPPAIGGSANRGGGANRGGSGGATGSGGTAGSANRGGGANRGGSGGAAGSGGTTPIALCGNGVVEKGEACDEGKRTPKSCAYGQTACSVCGPNCLRAPGLTSFCGDGKVDPVHEGCDDGNSVTELCPYGRGACTVCDSKCQKVPGLASSCGDGRVDAANQEECDDGNASTELCAYGETSCAVCGSRCTKTAGVVSYCGDGRLDSAHENCDPGPLPTEACAYGQTSCSVCGAACLVVSGKTSYCGDGVVDRSNGELCDLGATTSDCATSCPQSCSSIPGPTLTETIEGWPNSGLELTATDNATLQGFVFNNQGKEDTIVFERLSDGVVLGKISVPPGSSNTLRVAVSWDVTEGETYALHSVDHSNGRWTNFSTYPSQGSAGLRVDRLFAPIQQSQDLQKYWFTFTELRSCLR